MAKLIFWLLFIIAITIASMAAILNFEEFLNVAVTALILITGVFWAVRTTNIHQLHMAERNMQTYIYLYDTTSGEMKTAYRRIIESYNDSIIDGSLPHTKLFSYLMLYLVFSVGSLLIAEMLVLIYSSPQSCWLSHCSGVWWTAIIFTIFRVYLSSLRT